MSFNKRKKEKKKWFGVTEHKDINVSGALLMLKPNVAPQCAVFTNF